MGLWEDAAYHGGAVNGYSHTQEAKVLMAIRTYIDCAHMVSINYMHKIDRTTIRNMDYIYQHRDTVRFKN